MRGVVKEIRNVFTELAGEKGGLDMEGLKNALVKLHGSMEISEIKDLFSFIDLDESKCIELNEFLVALTIGMVLETIPGLGTRQTEAPSPLGTINRKPSISTFHGRQSEVNEMLNLIVSAYLLFDSKAEGFIRRESVEKLLDEAGKKSKKNAMLNIDRWNEMVTFPFLDISAYF